MSEQPSPLNPPAPPFSQGLLMELPLFTGFESMLEMAENDTATIDIERLEKTKDGRLSSVVSVSNLTGHYLPTGVGFRRMFVELLVLDREGATLWASGRTNELGFLLFGTSDQVLQSEQPLKFPSAAVQPHYQVIDAGNEVYSQWTIGNRGQSGHDAGCTGPRRTPRPPRGRPHASGSDADRAARTHGW